MAIRWAGLGVSAVLSIFTLGGSALQLAREEDDTPCGKGKIGYKAIHPYFPGVCTAYCLPRGICEEQVVAGKLSLLGIKVNGKGNCKQKGYIQTARFDNWTKNTNVFLEKWRNRTEKKLVAPSFPTEEFGQMIFAAIIDLLGFDMDSLTSDIGNFFEVIWSPTVSAVLEHLFDDDFVASFGFMEEMMPGTDIMPTATLGALVENFGSFKAIMKHFPNFPIMLENSLIYMLKGPCKSLTLTKFTRAPQWALPKDGQCLKGQKSYEAISPYTRGVCYVFCVPEGQCEAQLSMGRIKYLGITGEGNCKNKGYTLAGIAGRVTLYGPCRDMTHTKFQRPGPGPCGYEHKSYTAISPDLPSECSHFCVPKGNCENHVMMRNMKSLGIVKEGDCKQKGYTTPGHLGARALYGACRGMTTQRFKQDPCRTSQTAFESISPNLPGMCSVFCVPKGECEKRLRTGYMRNLSITGEGNCNQKGYTDLIDRFSHMSFSFDNGTLQTGCEEMTHLKFQRPTLEVSGQVKKNAKRTAEQNGNVREVLAIAHGPGQGWETDEPNANNPVELDIAVPGQIKKAVVPNVNVLEPIAKNTTITTSFSCESNKVSYEAYNPVTPTLCKVFCVPQGLCETQIMQDEKFSFLSISSKGNCMDKDKISTESSDAGSLAKLLQNDLDTIEGFCSGITILKWFW